MASEPELLELCGLAKVKEFLKLKYPRYVVKAACSYMAASTGERTWLNGFGIQSIRKQAYLSWIAQRSKGR